MLAVWPVLAIIAAAHSEMCVQVAGTATLFLVRTQAAVIGVTSHQLVSSGTRTSPGWWPCWPPGVRVRDRGVRLWGSNP